MRRTFQGVVGVALALTVFGTPAWAQNADKDKNTGASSTRGEETIRGIVSGFSMMGETVINYDTGRAEAAQVAYLTVLGSPDWSTQGQSGGDRDRNSGNNANANANTNSGNNANSSSRGNEQGAMHRRHNLYVLAITPRTKVKTAKGWSRDAIRSASEGSLDQVEIGDHVEVSFNPIASSNNRGGDNASNNANANSKHGRHRMFRGEIVTLAVLPPSNHHWSKDREREHDSSANSSDTKGASSSSSSSDKKDANKDR